MSRVPPRVHDAPGGHDDPVTVPLPDDVEPPADEVAAQAGAGAGAGATITPYRDGPLIVRGDFRLVDQDGHEIDPGRRTVALCRCGQSSIKPFCDGTHKRSGFSAASAPRRPRPASYLTPGTSGAAAQQGDAGEREPQVHRDEGGEAGVPVEAEGTASARGPGGRA